MRYEEPETDQPLVIGTLYIHKWAVKRLEDPEVIYSHHRAGLTRCAVTVTPTGT